MPDMQLIFADQTIPRCLQKSLFLAGPSPREKDVHDWRRDALEFLQQAQYDDLTVFIPVPKERFYLKHENDPSWTYDNQIEWECRCRQIADAIVFWIPRDIQGGMPAYTTNIEFGEDLHSGKIFYGRPDNAEKCRYLDKRFEEIKQPVFTTLKSLLKYAVEQLGNGAYRENGEVFVPFFIWNSLQFQSWYTNLKQAGNRLDEAKLVHHVKFRPGYDSIFCFILSVNIWVELEQRHKSDEFIFARKDISTIVAYYRDVDDHDEIKLILVKEFRSPVNNHIGFVYELPGGSSMTAGDNDPQMTAKHEMEEETGLTVDDISRFQYVGQRQLVATLCSHQAQVYKLELNHHEYQKLLVYAQDKNVTFGVNEDSEKTYIEVVSLSNIKNTPLDFSMLGMIYQALY